ncbi:MAG: hypothetical protein ACLFUS_11950, partial [Candidatus Sumerlaeia bacterium]
SILEKKGVGKPENSKFRSQSFFGVGYALRKSQDRYQYEGSRPRRLSQRSGLTLYPKGCISNQMIYRGESKAPTITLHKGQRE